VDVEPKKVVTFKPGKEMEDRVRKFARVPAPADRESTVVLGGDEEDGHTESAAGSKVTNRKTKVP
jgi:hypothetical protein